MQKTKGKVIRAIDKMVAPRHRKVCRDASGLDFDKLEGDTEITPHRKYDCLAGEPRWWHRSKDIR